MEQNNNTTVIELIKRLFKWRKSILTGTAIAFVISIIVALLLPTYYKAQTTFYAASQDLASPESVFGLSQTKTEYFGTNQDEDRIKAVARSKSMYEYLIDTFKLFDHYKIKHDDPKANYKIENLLRKRYKLLQSENDAIHIQFVDRSPDFTAAFANAATEKLKTLGVHEIKKSQEQMISGYEHFLDSKREDLIVLQDSLSLLRKEYNIIDRLTQAESLGTSLANAKARLIDFEERLVMFQRYNQQDSVRRYSSKTEGLKKVIQAMESDSLNSGISIAKFSEGSEKIFSVEREILALTKSRDETRQRLNYLKSAFTSETPSIHVIEYADVPEVKYWPIRSILVAGVTILVFLLLCFYALVKEGFDSIDWKNIKNASS